MGGCGRPVDFPFVAINLMDCKTAPHSTLSLGWAGQLDWPVGVGITPTPGSRTTSLGPLLNKTFPGDRDSVCPFSAFFLV